MSAGDALVFPAPRSARPEGRLLTVAISDCQVTGDPDRVLVTYALGSCIGVAIYDPAARVGGLLHFMLPQSAIDREKARVNPFMFADTGIPGLLGMAERRGANRRRLTVWVAGGAQVMDGDGVFNIGKRNYTEMRKIFWKAGLLVHAEAVGGAVSRTVKLDMATGKFLIREAGGAERELGPAPARGGPNGISRTAH